MRYAVIVFIAACEPRLGFLPRNAAWAGGTFNADLCPRAAPALYRCTSSSQPRVALAVCGDLQANNTLTLDPRAASPADLWVSGASTTASALQVAGSFFSAGTVGAPNTQDVGGDFRTGGDWQTSAPVHVGGDATVSGTLTANNTVSVGGILTAAAENGPGTVSAGGTHTAETVFSSPLACAAEPVVASFVADTRHDSNAEAAVPPLALSAITQPTTLTMGCGRYHLASLTANNTLTIHVVGPVVLVVDGNVDIAAPTQIEMADGGSLDFVIGGDLAIDNTLTIGDPAHPVWVAVSGTLRVASPAQVYGTLLAPKSAVAADNTLDVWGAAMTGALNVGSPVAVHDGPSLTADGCVL